MSTVPPAPPPPVCRNHPGRSSPTPCPVHAAIPIRDSPPVPETSPSPEALHVDAPAAPPLPVENGLQLPPSVGPEDDASGSAGKHGPVQETGPAAQAPNGPQMTEQQDEAATQRDEATEDHLL